MTTQVYLVYNTRLFGWLDLRSLYTCLLSYVRRVGCEGVAGPWLLGTFCIAASEFGIPRAIDARFWCFVLDRRDVRSLVLLNLQSRCSESSPVLF